MARDLSGNPFTLILHFAPLAPLASRADVESAMGCRACTAGPGEPCRRPPVTFAAAMLFGPEWRGLHMRRYLDHTGDRR